MSHMKETEMSQYLNATDGRSGTMVGNAVSDLHDNPEVFHQALRQAILIERDVFWHEFNRWKLCAETKWILRQKCKEITDDVLYTIITEVERSNRAAAEAYHSAGVVNR